MNRDVRDDSHLSPRLFQEDPKSEAEQADQADQPLDTGVPVVESPEAPEIEAPLACRDVPPEGHTGGASCDRIHTVYLLRDQAGVLLYVGVTLRAHDRWKQHGKSKPWWPEVKALEVEHFATRREAEAREALLIRTLHPRHNVHHRAHRVEAQEGPPCDECGAEMVWWAAEEVASSAFEYEGFVFSGWWFCDHCCDEDHHPPPPEYAALGLASDPVLRDLLAATKMRRAASELAEPYHLRCIHAAIDGIGRDFLVPDGAP